MANWMIYGANGYTGELIAREAVKRGLAPILAGRTAPPIAKLAAELQTLSRVFDLSNPAKIEENLSGATILLNCAGPFSATAEPLMNACLSAGVHYLDITGEMDVIERAAKLDARAKQAGVALIPAAGFDVVPSDCLAAKLKARLPDAMRLLLAFTGANTMSPGTSRTAVESLPKGGRIRRDGEIVKVPLAWKEREIPFRDGTRNAVTIPWGDVASAFYSTGIGNIEVYTTISLKQLRGLRRWRWLIPALKFKPLRRFIQGKAAQQSLGPTAGERATSRVSLWGRVENEAGQAAEATLITPNAYDLTVSTTLAIVERIIGAGILPGFHTPSQAFGADFILSIPGTDLRIEAV